MNLDSITLLRTKSKVMNRIKLLAPGVLFVCLVISLLFILVGMIYGIYLYWGDIKYEFSDMGFWGWLIVIGIFGGIFL